MAIDLLSAPIRKYIRDKRWEQLRPIQAAAITKIMTTSNNYILASRTASGKTEAAFLPILSKVPFNEPGVQVLYISPLIALINDQFYRIEELCKYLEVPVTKWHGEANRTLKERLLADPSGIVLITPESIEAMFVNKPYYVRQLFSNLKYVVIDEIHSFIGNDRGTQLKSLLARLQQINSGHFSVVGFSATIGDYKEAKKFTGDEAATTVLLDKTAKDINALFRYFEHEGEELPVELLKDLYTETKDNKVLIFPNSRGRAEEIAVKLRKISDRVGGHPNYFSHHSSVDRDMREWVEHFAKTNVRQNFCISCTSTLELGIDIGSVDEVVQVDATHSIASLIQRVGRSGRKEGASSNLFLYATKPWFLLQSLACWVLYGDGFIEPPLVNGKPYDILLHQALSVTKGYSGIAKMELIKQLQENYAFHEISRSDIEKIIQHLIDIDLLEQLQQELIIGVEGDKIVNSRDFYTVFKTEENFKVVQAGRTIGEIPFSPQIIEDANLLLAAKIWKIVFVDMKAKKIEVVPAKDGKKPMFFGSGANVHQAIREKMLELLYNKKVYDVLDPSSADALEEIRNKFSAYPITEFTVDRPVIDEEESCMFYSFASTRVNRTIGFLFSLAGVKYYADDASSSFEIQLSYRELVHKWGSLFADMENIDLHIEQFLSLNPAVLDFSKWGIYLPLEYQINLVKEKYFDFIGVPQVQPFKLLTNT